jgi:hypothetical protein
MTKDEFELRGKLATLKCWHRLTQEEEEDLLRFAAAQPAQEPVGKFAKFTDGIWHEVTDGSPGVFLYTAPIQRTWVGLTDEQIKTIDEMALTKNMAIAMTMATLKEKNNG